MTARVVGQMNEHLLAEPAAAKGRTDIHALELAVLRAADLDAAATRRHPSLPDDEESDLFAEQLADAIPVAALARIQGHKIGFQLFYERRSVDTIRPFSFDYQHGQARVGVQVWRF